MKNEIESVFKIEDLNISLFVVDYTYTQHDTQITELVTFMVKEDDTDRHHRSLHPVLPLLCLCFYFYRGFLTSFWPLLFSALVMKT